MANYCSNNLTVNGKGGAVKQFIQENFRSPKVKNGEYAGRALDDYVLDFEQFDPTPIDEKTNDVIEDWYNWRLQHWGCKWSPGDQTICLIVEDENGNRVSFYDYSTVIPFSEKLVNELDVNKNMKLELSCYCETPWGPPEAMFMQWYERYKDLGLECKLQFYEPGCEILGELWFSGDEYYCKYLDSYDSKEWIEYILEVGWVTRDWYIKECFNCIEEMHPEMADKLIDKITEFTANCSTEEAATLFSDILDKYNKWNNGELDEPSKE